MGPGNVGLELFAQLQKIQVKCQKKALKTGQKGVKKLFSPHTFKIITFVGIFYFQYFSFWCFTDPLF